MVRRGGQGLSGDPTAAAAAHNPALAGIGDETERDTGREAGPLRRCIATGRSLPKAALIRFVVDPDGAVVPDLTGRLPGRGLWVVAERAAVERAVARNLFSRAARRPVAVPADLADRIVSILRQSCINLVAMARRAGQAVGGYEKVRARLGARHGRAARGGVLLVARDAGRDGRGKVVGLAAARPDVTVVDALDADALGAAFARDRVVHALVERGGLAERLEAEAARLAGMVAPEAGLPDGDRGAGGSGRTGMVSIRDGGGTGRPDATAG